MAMQRNKLVLEGNIYHTNDQRLVVTGMPAPLLLVQRDAIKVEQDIIEMKDKRNVPTGRNNAGEFNCIIQLAHDTTREAMLAWYDLCLDHGNGISATYKRDAMLTYRRLFRGNPGTEFSGAGSPGGDFQLRIIGLFVKSLEFPEFTMDGAEDAEVPCAFSYDDVEPIQNKTVGPQIGGLTTSR